MHPKPDMISISLFQKIYSFPKISDALGESLRALPVTIDLQSRAAVDRIGAA